MWIPLLGSPELHRPNHSLRWNGYTTPPPPIICGRRRPLLLIADNLSASRRCHFCCVLIYLFCCCNFRRWLKKVIRKFWGLRIERNFFRNLWKQFFWSPTPRRCRQFFGTGGAPPSTQLRRRKALFLSLSAIVLTDNKVARALHDC